MSPLCAIDLQPIVTVLLGAVGVIIGWYLLFVVGFALIRAPIVVVAALVQGKKPDEDDVWVVFGELVVLIVAAFLFHILKWG